MSPTEENYLKTLLHLENKLGEATANKLSKSLGIKMSTVNSMMKKLSEKGFVHYESYKPLTLTELGRKEAALILRKHRLTEMYLVEKMGFGWEEVHAIAEQVEHIDSALFFDRMDELLNHPHIDPHGSPIPDRNGILPETNFRKLSDCLIGEKIVFKAVTDSSAKLLSFLGKRGIKLGMSLIIKHIEEFDGCMTISYPDNSEGILSKVACEKLLVSK